MGLRPRLDRVNRLYWRSSLPRVLEHDPAVLELAPLDDNLAILCVDLARVLRVFLL